MIPAAGSKRSGAGPFAEPSTEPAVFLRPTSFPRAYRLKRQRLIRALFDRSREDIGSLAVGCLRLVYRVVPRDEVGEEVPVQVGFAPGRRVRRAVARNRIKRLLREVYRVNQHLLIDLSPFADRTLTLMVLFRGNPDTAAQEIPRDLPEALRRLRARLPAGETSVTPEQPT